jgi:hypothetical protein
VHLFRPSLGFLAEAQKQARTKRHILALHFLGISTKQKNIIAKITNLFCIYFFQIDKFINKYILTIFFIVFFISLPIKWEIYYLQYNY